MISDCENYSIWALNWQLLDRYTLADVEDQYNLFYTVFNNSKEALMQKDLLARINREYDEKRLHLHISIRLDRRGMTMTSGSPSCRPALHGSLRRSLCVNPS